MIDKLQIFPLLPAFFEEIEVSFEEVSKKGCSSRRWLTASTLSSWRSLFGRLPKLLFLSRETLANRELVLLLSSLLALPICAKPLRANLPNCSFSLEIEDFRKQPVTACSVLLLLSLQTVLCEAFEEIIESVLLSSFEASGRIRETFEDFPKLPGCSVPSWTLHARSVLRSLRSGCRRVLLKCRRLLSPFGAHY